MRQSLRHPIVAAVGAVLCLGAVAPVAAASDCIDARRRVEEAGALRFQARQESRLGRHDRVCDTLDEVGDRYHDAQDAFEDCGQAAVAIDLRSELRVLEAAKRVNRCD